MFLENLLGGLRDCSDRLSCSSHREQGVEKDKCTQTSPNSQSKPETKPRDKEMKEVTMTGSFMVKNHVCNKRMGCDIAFWELRWD